MLDKLKIVLYKPRFIGLYIKENTFLLILKLLVCILIALAPSFITTASQKEVSSAYEQYLVQSIVSTNIKDVYIQDNVLYYETPYEVDCYYFNLLIGTDVDTSEISNITTNNLVFLTNEIKFYASNVQIYSTTYEALNITDIDFELISTTNVQVMNTYINIFNKLYQENHSVITLYSCIKLFIDCAINVFILSLILALISKVFNSSNIMPFVFRYKMCLNCQFIYLLLLLISNLYGFNIVSYIGTFVMSLYAFTAMNSITMVKKG